LIRHRKYLDVHQRRRAGAAPVIDDRELPNWGEAMDLSFKDCVLQVIDGANDRTWTDTPTASDVAFLKITARVIPILDYSKGVGHAELVTA
jgi:hypothetical protein